MKFDGRSTWLSFKRKFNSYRDVMHWSEEECKDYLMWSLEGKALDFFTITTTESDRYSFRRIMKKLETRFGSKELTETSIAKFRQACQRPDETLEDWADRVMTLATPAFIDLPELNFKQEAIAKFCQGCNDKKAAKHACLENPSSMEEALNMVRHHQYISQAVDGKRYKKGKDDVYINAVQNPSDAKMERMLSVLEKFTNKLQMQEPQSASYKAAPSQEKQKKVAMQCFFCKKFGHFKKDCKIYEDWVRRQQKKPGNLNEKGWSGKTTRSNPKK